MVRVLAACATVAVLLVPGPAPGSTAGAVAGCTITQDRSTGGTIPTSIEFVNATNAVVLVYWLDYNGVRQFWFRLQAGVHFVQQTFVGHAWVVTDTAGTCIGFVVGEQAAKSYVITAPTSPPPPPPPPPKPKPAAPTIAAFYVDSHPALPAAGTSFTIVGHLVLSNGASVGAASLKCGAKLAGTRLPGGGRGGCIFHIPKTAVGKRLAVTVSATYRGKTKTRTVAFTVRRAPPKPKPKPKPSPPPTTVTPAITTPAGSLLVDGVQITDRFPPACIPNTPFCDTANPGYEILVVWLKVASGNQAAIVTELRNAKVVLVASDGSQTKPYSVGLLSGRLFLAFTPRSTSHGFKLIWPGNPPIPLGK
jgi:VHL beta domain